MAKFGLGVGAEKGNIIGYTREGEPVYAGDMRIGGTKDPEQLRPLEPVAKAIREGDAERYGAPVGRNSISEALPPMPPGLSGRGASGGMGASARRGNISDALPPMPEPLGGPQQTPAPNYPGADAAGYGRAGAAMPAGAAESTNIPPSPSPLAATPDPLGSIEDDEGSDAGLYAAGASATGLASLLAQRRNKLPPAPDLGGELVPLGRETAGRPLKNSAVGKAKLAGLGAGSSAKPGVASEGTFAQLGGGQKVLPGGKNLPGSPKSKVASAGKPLQLGEGQRVLPGSAAKKALPGSKTPLQLTDPNAPIDLGFLGGDSNSGYLPHKLTQPEDTIRFDPYSGPIENDAGAIFDAAAKGGKPKTPAYKPSAKDPMAATADRLGSSRALKDNVNANTYVASKQKGGYLATDAGKKLSSSVGDVVDAATVRPSAKSALGASIAAGGDDLAAARTALQSLGKTAKASQIAETLAPHVIPLLEEYFRASNVTADGKVHNPDAALKSVKSELRKIYGSGKPQADIDAVASKLAKLLMGRK